MTDMVIREEIMNPLTQNHCSQCYLTLSHNTDDTILTDAIPRNYMLIDMKSITQMIGMTDKWIYSLIKKQLFPKPIKLGRSSRWRLRDIEQWIDEQAMNH